MKSNLNPFKFGDHVRCTVTISPEQNGPLKGEVFRVKSVDNLSIGFVLLRLPVDSVYSGYTKEVANGIVPNWHYSCFELISDAEYNNHNAKPDVSTAYQAKEERIQTLILKVNVGRRALTELFEICPDRIEIKDIGGYGNDWRQLKSARKLIYRAASKTMKTWTTSNGWKVVEKSGEVYVGCEPFDKTPLLNDLTAMIERNVSRSVNYNFVATKNGIKYKEHLLSWKDAERLLKDLKELK